MISKPLSRVWLRKCKFDELCFDELGIGGFVEFERRGADGDERPVRRRCLLKVIEERFAGELLDFSEDFCAAWDASEVDPIVSDLGASRVAAFLFHD